MMRRWVCDSPAPYPWPTESPSTYAVGTHGKNPPGDGNTSDGVKLDRTETHTRIHRQPHPDALCRPSLGRNETGTHAQRHQVLQRQRAK
jgi:hypothetical protein